MEENVILQTIEGLNSNNEEMQQNSVDMLINITDNGTPVQALVTAGVIPDLGRFLLTPANVNLREGAVQILARIIAERQTFEDNDVLLSLIWMFNYFACHPENIQLLADRGVFRSLVELLENQDMQYAAFYAVQNIYNDFYEHTNVLVDAGILPVLIRLLHSERQNIFRQAVDALIKIVHIPEYRNMFINFHGVNEILPLVGNNAAYDVLRYIAKLLNVLCLQIYSNDGVLPLDTAQLILPALIMLIQHQDQYVISQAVSAISRLTDGGNEHLRLVFDSTAVNFLIHFINHNNTEIQVHAVWVVTKIIYSNITDDIAFYCNLLEVGNNVLLQQALTKLESFLRAAGPNRREEIRQAITNSGGLARIQNFQMNQNAMISNVANRIIPDFFA